MIGSNAWFELTDRQKKALTNRAERKGINKPTVKGMVSRLIEQTDDYKALEPKPNGETL